jgi:hypothetical protein
MATATNLGISELETPARLARPLASHFFALARFQTPLVWLGDAGEEMEQPDGSVGESSMISGAA